MPICPLQEVIKSFCSGLFDAALRTVLRLVAQKRPLFGLNMVKLSVELIEQAAQYTNPVKDRELDLRGESNFLPGSFVKTGLW